MFRNVVRGATRAASTSAPRALRTSSFLVARLYASAASSQLNKTALYPLHEKLGARFVPFAGYSMPVTYGETGQVESHNHVRKSVGLFDVGHMVQSYIAGPSATEFMEWLTPSSFSTMKPFTHSLSLLLNEQGGIIDDTVICKHTPEKYYVVTNAACREGDVAWINSRLEIWNKGKAADQYVTFTILEGWGLVALQGPKAAESLQAHTSFDLKKLVFGTSSFVNIAGVECHVARSGYTGEDGFEISIPPAETLNITSTIVSDPKVMPIGLGARDSLRLEAGMCLYGNDLDETVTPAEGGLGWIVPASRRETGGFIGDKVVLPQLQKGAVLKRRRTGLLVEGSPARQGAKILDTEGEEIGVVTSGIPSPTLSKNIAMGYVPPKYWKKGTEVQVVVRGKPRKATVVRTPFVADKYWRGDAAGLAI